MIAPSPAVESLAQRIFLVRGRKVMLDADLAELYGVETRVLVQAVKRNPGRFPPDFMFQLAKPEWEALRSQLVISKGGRGGRRYAPYAFTEHGALMLASVLTSAHAIDMSILVVRAFVRLREMLSAHRELATKLDELERKLATHDQAIAGLISTIRQLTMTPDPKKRSIGFTADLAAASPDSRDKICPDCA